MTDNITMTELDHDELSTVEGGITRQQFADWCEEAAKAMVAGLLFELL